MSRHRNLIAALGTLILGTQLTATSIIPMSIERLTQASTNVVRAQADDSWTEWNPQHTLIYTVTRFHVQRSLKAQAADEIFVKQLGGVNGAYQQKVAGVRYWRQGEDCVLFLHPARSHDGRYVVTGLMQGNFTVKGEGADAVVSNGIAGVEAFDPHSRSMRPYHGASMRLSELEARVKKAAL